MERDCLHSNLVLFSSEKHSCLQNKDPQLLAAIFTSFEYSSMDFLSKLHRRAFVVRQARGGGGGGGGVQRGGVGVGECGGGQEEPLPRPHPFPQVRNPVLSSCCSNTAEPRCLWGNLSTLYKISTKITSHLVMGFYLLGSNCSRLNALSHFASEVPLIFPFLPSICSVPRIPPAQASLLEDLWIGRTPWLDLSGFALCEGEEQGF